VNNFISILIFLTIHYKTIQTALFSFLFPWRVRHQNILQNILVLQEDIF